MTDKELSAKLSAIIDKASAARKQLNAHNSPGCEAHVSDLELAVAEVAEECEDRRKDRYEEENGPGDNVLLKQHDPVTPFTMLDKDYPERYKP